MSSQKPKVPRTGRTAAITQPITMSEIVLHICEDNDEAIARSMEKLQAFDLDFGKRTDAFLELEVSDKAGIFELLSIFQLMIDHELEAKTREAAASNASLQAFRRKVVTKPTDSTLVEIFTRVLNDASPDVIVRDLLNDFAINFMSMGRNQQMTQEQASTNMGKSAPNSEVC
jgi:hypothetical protein